MFARNSLLCLLTSFCISSNAFGALVTEDEIIYIAGQDASVLSATIDMSVSGQVLTVTATNTSIGNPGSDSGLILSGFGFNLPIGLSISSGSVDMTGSTAVNFAFPSGGDISDQWAYHNGLPTSGHFDGTSGGGDGPAVNTVNAVISSHHVDGTTPFSGSGISNGLDYGLVSDAPFSSGGLEAIRNSATFSIILAGTVPSDLVAQIDSNPIILAFGSPTAGGSTAIPEPSAFALLGLIFAALIGNYSRNKLTASQKG